jgi:hypothetical protein
MQHHGMAVRRSGSSSALRVRAHRERLRAQGLRPIQIWVPDVASPQFVSAAHAQSIAVADSDHERDNEAFIDAVSTDE